MNTDPNFTPSGETAYNASGLSDTQVGVMADSIAGQMSNGTGFHVTGDQAPAVITAAQSIMAERGILFTANGTQGGQPTGSQSTTSKIAEAIGNAVFPGVGTVAVASTPSPGTWLESHAANWGLIVLGVLLGIGALLISQKDTIINVGTKAAGVVGKVAEVAAVV